MSSGVFAYPKVQTDLGKDSISNRKINDIPYILLKKNVDFYKKECLDLLENKICVFSKICQTFAGNFTLFF